MMLNALYKDLLAFMDQIGDMVRESSFGASYLMNLRRRQANASISD